MGEEKTARRLYRSKRNRVLAGVCGGIGEYLGVDPVVVRLVWIALALLRGVGIILYVLAALMIPEEPKPGVEQPPVAPTSKTLVLAAGLLMLLVGVLGLLSTVFGIPLFQFIRLSWEAAVFLIVAVLGFAIIVKTLSG